MRRREMTPTGVGKDEPRPGEAGTGERNVPMTNTSIARRCLACDVVQPDCRSGSTGAVGFLYLGQFCRDCRTFFHSQRGDWAPLRCVSWGL